MFHFPVTYCAIAQSYVPLDRVQRECARDHGCYGVDRCPLQGYFVEYCRARDLHVVLHQTQRECALEHGCEGLRCPLQKSFTASELGEAPGVVAS